MDGAVNQQEGVSSTATINDTCGQDPDHQQWEERSHDYYREELAKELGKLNFQSRRERDKSPRRSTSKPVEHTALLTQRRKLSDSPRESVSTRREYGDTRSWNSTPSSSQHASPRDNISPRERNTNNFNTSHSTSPYSSPRDNISPREKRDINSFNSSPRDNISPREKINAGSLNSSPFPSPHISPRENENRQKVYPVPVIQIIDDEGCQQTIDCMVTRAGTPRPKSPSPGLVKLPQLDNTNTTNDTKTLVRLPSVSSRPKSAPTYRTSPKDSNTSRAITTNTKITRQASTDQDSVQYHNAIYKPPVSPRNTRKHKDDILSDIQNVDPETGQLTPSTKDKASSVSTTSIDFNESVPTSHQLSPTTTDDVAKENTREARGKEKVSIRKRGRSLSPMPQHQDDGKFMSPRPPRSPSPRRDIETSKTDAHVQNFLSTTPSPRLRRRPKSAGYRERDKSPGRVSQTLSPSSSPKSRRNKNISATSLSQSEHYAFLKSSWEDLSPEITMTTTQPKSASPPVRHRDPKVQTSPSIDERQTEPTNPKSSTPPRTPPRTSPSTSPNTQRRQSAGQTSAASFKPPYRTTPSSQSPPNPRKAVPNYMRNTRMTRYRSLRATSPPDYVAEENDDDAQVTAMSSAPDVPEFGPPRELPRVYTNVERKLECRDFSVDVKPTSSRVISEEEFQEMRKIRYLRTAPHRGQIHDHTE